MIPNTCAKEKRRRSAGFGVISVSSEVEARFEVEMGRCGVLLICYTIPSLVCEELAGLFKRSCPAGLIFVVAKNQESFTSDADLSIPDSEGPEGIVRTLHANLNLPKAS